MGFQHPELLGAGAVRKGHREEGHDISCPYGKRRRKRDAGYAAHSQEWLCHKNQNQGAQARWLCY